VTSGVATGSGTTRRAVTGRGRAAGGKRLLLLKRLIDQVLDRAEPGPVAISAADHWWWHISRYDSAVVTDASQQGVRLRRRDRKQMLRLARHGAAVCLRLVREGHAVRRRYLAAQPVLTSRENWERLFRQGDD
ncbi:MAG TPA: hypothetical protein VGJ95_08760, partial [Pseudonocardiaceae bacterium]